MTLIWSEPDEDCLVCEGEGIGDDGNDCSECNGTGEYTIRGTLQEDGGILLEKNE